MSASTTTLTETQKKYLKQVQNPWLMGFYFFSKVPAGFFAGMRLRTLTLEKSVTTIPFKWLNKNPFKSIYFAVQSMAAELSTAAPCMLAIAGKKPSIALIIVDLEATFHKRATGKTTFVCEDVPRIFQAVEECIQSGEPKVVKAKTVGTLADGTVVSTFHFTWSFKQRNK